MTTMIRHTLRWVDDQLQERRGGVWYAVPSLTEEDVLKDLCAARINETVTEARLRGEHDLDRFARQAKEFREELRGGDVFGGPDPTATVENHHREVIADNAHQLRAISRQMAKLTSMIFKLENAGRNS